MRVAAVFLAMPVGGAEDLAVGWARELVPHGVQTSFVCLRSKGEIGLEIEAAGGDFSLVPAAPRKRFSWQGPGLLAEWLKSRRIDLVHSHIYHSHTYAVPAARRAGIPVVLHQHKTLEAMKWHRKWTLKGLFRKADRVVALSEQTATDLRREFRLPEERVCVLSNTIDTEAFCPREPGEVARLRSDCGLSDRGFLIGTVASLNPVKNHEATLRAMAAAGGDIRALLLGEGASRPALEAWVRELSLGDRVFLPGTKRPVAPWMRCLDLFVFPSFWEGQSLALLQAVSAGIPVLASRIEGNVAVLGHSHPGLFDPHNVEEYSALLHRAAHDQAFLGDLLASQSCISVPPIGDSARKLLAIYRQALPSEG